MKVKIGNKIVDSNDEPIMIIFENVEDRYIHTKNMRNMSPDAFKYCVFPYELSPEYIKEFMKTK
jgi:hypothetical protein